MSRPLALDLFCGAGGVSWGLYLAGFDVVGVDLRPQPHHPAHHREEYARHFRFVHANALEYPLDGFDFIWASPPCQAHTSLRAIHPGREYPDLIPATRERLEVQATPWCIENVPGSPLGRKGSPLLMLCGSMFGLQTLDGSAELRRHRWFETSWPVGLRPQCQHGHVTSDVITVVGKKGLSGLSHARRAISVTGQTPQTNVVRNQVRRTYSTDDGRWAMGDGDSLDADEEPETGHPAGLRGVDRPKLPGVATRQSAVEPRLRPGVRWRGLPPRRPVVPRCCRPAHPSRRRHREH